MHAYCYAWNYRNNPETYTNDYIYTTLRNDNIFSQHGLIETIIDMV